MSLACPHCGSDNTQKLSMLFDSGTVVSTSKSRGAAITSGGQLVLGGAISTGKNQSLLALQHRPPRDSRLPGCARFFLGAIVAFGVGALFGGTAGAVFYSAPAGAIAFVAGLLFSIVIFWCDGKKKASTYQMAYEEWARKFLCLRCGKTFGQTPPTVASIPAQT